jgi:hypothetical protein
VRFDCVSFSLPLDVVVLFVTIVPFPSVDDIWARVNVGPVNQWRAGARLCPSSRLVRGSRWFAAHAWTVDGPQFRSWSSHGFSGPLLSCLLLSMTYGPF